MPMSSSTAPPSSSGCERVGSSSGPSSWATSTARRSLIRLPDRDVLLEIDLQGAVQVRALRPDARLILLLPPSAEVQAERMRARGDDEARIAERVRAGRDEERQGLELADAVVVNAGVSQAASEVAGIVERCRRGDFAGPPVASGA